MHNPVLYLISGFLICLLGSIPLGPINLSVVKTTIDHHTSAGMRMALAASLVEIGETTVAIFFGMLIAEFIATNLYFKLGLASAFLVLAVWMYLRRPGSTIQGSNEETVGYFRRGLLIALLNPQAVPFWIVALAALGQFVEFTYSGLYLVFFLVGVFFGKLVALGVFVLASAYVKQHLAQSGLVINRLLAVILLLLGVSQLWSAIDLFVE